MAGHLARNQVHAGSIPAALTKHGEPAGAVRHPHSGRCSWESSRSPKPTDSVRIVADPQRGPNGLGYLYERMPRGQTPRPRAWKAPPNGRQRVPKTRIVALSPRGSIPPPSSSVESPSGKAPSCTLGTRRFDSALDLTPLPRSRCSWPHAGSPGRRRGFDSPRALNSHLHRCPNGEDPVFQTGDASSILARCSTPEVSALVRPP